MACRNRQTDDAGNCESTAPTRQRHPGKPTQNASIESFNARFRHECLNENKFANLAEARQIIEAWRLDYDALRPHKALNNQTPEEFARRLQITLPLNLSAA